MLEASITEQNPSSGHVFLESVVRFITKMKSIFRKLQKAKGQSRAYTFLQ